jgi:signal transduction histidine kinase
LINNALEASKDEIISVTVKLNSLKNNYAQLIIEDNGPGIQEENLQRIFDPFFSTKPYGYSSGLGLGIVKELVDQFKGTIDVTSKNKITQFIINLPAVANTN